MRTDNPVVTEFLSLGACSSWTSPTIAVFHSGWGGDSHCCLFLKAAVPQQSYVVPEIWYVYGEPLVHNESLRTRALKSAEAATGQTNLVARSPGKQKTWYSFSPAFSSGLIPQKRCCPQLGWTSPRISDNLNTSSIRLPIQVIVICGELTLNQL